MRRMKRLLRRRQTAGGGKETVSGEGERSERRRRSWWEEGEDEVVPEPETEEAEGTRSGGNLERMEFVCLKLELSFPSERAHFNVLLKV